MVAHLVALGAMAEVKVVVAKAAASQAVLMAAVVLVMVEVAVELAVVGMAVGGTAAEVLVEAGSVVVGQETAVEEVTDRAMVAVERAVAG